MDKNFITFLEKLAPHERKLVQDALRDSEEQFRLIIEHSVEPVIIVDKKGTVCFINLMAEKLFGYKRKDFLGQIFDYPIISGKATQIDIINREGKRIIAEMSAVESTFHGESVYLASLRDITQRKLMEEELIKHRYYLEELVEERTSELKAINEKLQKEIFEHKKTEYELIKERSMLEHIIDLNPCGIIVTDKNGYPVKVNQSFMDIFEFEPLSEQSFFLNPLLYHSGITYGLVKNQKAVILPEICYNPSDIDPSLRNVKKSIRSMFFPILTSDGDIENIVFIYEDITGSKMPDH